MIKIENVTKDYGKFVAVDNISFEVSKGEVVGFLGPNGAGKTTTMRIITGYFLPTSGSVFINEIDMEEDPFEAKRLIGYLPENPPLYPEMPVEDYLRHVGLLKGISKEHVEESIDFVIGKTHLEEKRYSKIKTLSKGLKQRVGIAGAIIHDPEILILDEPTIGLDPLQIIEIRNLIKEIGRNKTILLSSHILAEVQEVCDRVLIINKGKIIAKDTKENLKKKLVNGMRFRLKIKEDEDKVVPVLQNIPGVKAVDKVQGRKNEYSLLTEENEKIQASLSKSIVNSDLTLLEIKEEDMTLEEIFAKVIQED